MKRSIFPLLLLVLLFSACTIKYVPVQTEGVTITDDFGVNRTKAYTFAAANEYWNREPQELTNYFITFYVSIQNRKRDDLQVETSDFGLIDQNGNQYRAYPPEKISQIIKSDPEYAVKPQDVTFVMPDLATYTDPMDPPPYLPGSSFGSPYYDAGLGHWVYPSGVYDRYRRDQPGETLMQDIFLDSLPVGNVIDGAQVSGNLYFKLDYRDIKSVRLRADINGTIIELPFVMQ